MSTIHVCPLSALDEVLASSKARTMITLAGPGKSIERPGQIDRGFLALEFNDIAQPLRGLVAPDRSHVGQLIDFLRQWEHSHALLIQCWMGISRSTAAALIAQTVLDPERDMDALADGLRQASPMATPNPLMISIADQMLGLDNRLVNAVRNIGRGAEASLGTPFFLEAGH